MNADKINENNVAQSLKDTMAKLLSGDDKPNDALLLTATLIKKMAKIWVVNWLDS